MTPITVALVEDNVAVCTSLETVLRQSGDCHCIGRSHDAAHALRTIPKLRPQVVIMDINLPDLSGIECTARLKRLLPDTQILILTVYNESRQILQALEAGASGYLLKRSTPDEIVQAVRDVHAGGAPMNAEIARKVVQSFHKPAAHTLKDEALTPREIEILGYLAQGQATKEIADQLGVSYATVCSHLGHIYGKLHVRSRTAAVVKYLRQAGPGT